MRVSTVALYTFAALAAQDITSQSIAASVTGNAPPPDAAPTAAPVDKGLTPAELVAPIAPAEAFPIELSTTDKFPVAPVAPAFTEAAPVIPEAVETKPAAALTPVPPPSSAQPTANSAPVFSAPPQVSSAVEQIAAPQPAPLMQTLNEAALLEKSQPGQPGVTIRPSTVSVSNLTLEEIKALQQSPSEQAKATAVTPAPTAKAPTTPAALVSANLAEQATVTFGNPTQSGSAAANSANQPPAVGAPGHDAHDGFSLSVFTPSDNARSYYNLTTRPASQLSNGNVSLLFPLSIPAAITSAFGWRVHPVMGSARFHAGTDLGAPQGTPVLAALDGKVEIADFVGGYGLTIVLKHEKGNEQTLYGHLSEIFVQPGDTIKQGEAIGRVGSTGLSTGPHLHFEFRKLTQEGWTLIDPGPALEYALLHFNPTTQVAQANPLLKLPTLFKYSGKFLGAVEVAAQNKTAPNTQAANSQQKANPRSIATSDRQITQTRSPLRSQSTARQSSTPQG